MYQIERPEPTAGDTEWFQHDRFGLFIHWGLYSMPGRHEWIKKIERMTTEEYDKYFKRFDPDLYDPDLWAAAAADAGMKYFVVTTKHHEGFCLWDSDLTDYKATNTPAGRDLLAPMVDAFRAKNMKVGFYHSLLDWHHPHYTDRPAPSPKRRRRPYAALDSQRDLAEYARYLHGQTRELLTRFGKVDVLWYDFSVEASAGDRWQGEGRLEERGTARFDPRACSRRSSSTTAWRSTRIVKTPEQFQPREWVKIGGKPVVWEACQTFSGSWGYHRDEESMEERRSVS